MGVALASTRDVPASATTDAQKLSKVYHLAEMSDEERKRLRDLHRARKAYRGDWKGHEALKIGANEPDDNVNVNRCGPIVEKGASWLANKEIKLQVMNAAGTDAGPVAAQDYLTSAIGNIDDFMTLLTDLKVSGGVAGHAFAKLIPGKRKNQFPRIIALDPANVWVEADPEDVTTANCYNIQYDWRNPADPTGPWQKRQVIERNNPPDLMEEGSQAESDTTWTITTYARPKPKDISGNLQAAAWIQQGEPEQWNHSWAPIHDCKNLPSECSYYGTPDITPDLIHLNEVLNRVLSYIAKICRLHGHPWPWTAGVEAKAIQVAPGNIICLPDPNQKLEIAEAHGDLVNMMHYAESLRSDMDELSRVPGVALGRIDVLPRGNLPGTAMELLFQPLIEKTTHVRRLYGGGLIRPICEHILELGGFPDLTVNIVWPNLLPIDDSAAAQTGTLLMTLGVSQDTILQELGYDPDIEANKTADEQNRKQKQAAGFLSKAGSIPAAAAEQALGGTNTVAPPVKGNNGAPPPPVNHPAAVAARAKLSEAVGNG